MLDIKDASVDVKNNYILYNNDAREVHTSQCDLLLTECPKVSWMPKEEIELVLARFRPKNRVIFYDYDIDKVNPLIQYEWDSYTKYKEFLIPWIIDRCTIKGDVVLDPFAGYNSIGLIALAMQRRFIGIESDDQIYKIGKERICQSLIT